MTIEERLVIYKKAYKYFNRRKYLPEFLKKYTGFCAYFAYEYSINKLDYLSELYSIGTLYELVNNSYWYAPYSYKLRARLLKEVIRITEKEISIK